MLLILVTSEKSNKGNDVTLLIVNAATALVKDCVLNKGIVVNAVFLNVSTHDVQFLKTSKLSPAIEVQFSQPFSMPSATVKILSPKESILISFSLSPALLKYHAS